MKRESDDVLFFNLPDIEQVDIAILRDKNRFPHIHKEFISSSVVISIVMQGESYGFYDHQPIHVSQNDVSIVFPYHSCMDDVTTQDYRVTLIVLSPSIIKEIDNVLNYGTRSRFHYQPSIHLSDTQFETILHAVDTLEAITQMDKSTKRREMIISMIQIIGRLLDYYRGDQNIESPVQTRKEEIFNQFYSMLTAQYQEEHSVNYYAEQLHLNPKYLSRAIYNATGHTANYWIEEVLTVHAKKMLINYPTMPVKEICYKLGFGEVPNFTRFFRRNTGYSPIQFRKLFLYSAQ